MNSTSSAQVAEYVARINQVLDYIENHLDEALNIETVARVAGFSPYHFHRLFSAMLGETLFSFIGRLRMEKAARLLCAHMELPVTEIALSCGFSSPAAFSRAFKEAFQATPSEWKTKRGFSKTGKEKSSLYQALRNTENAMDFRLSYDDYIKNISIRRENMKALQGEVKVETLKKMTLAYIRHIGPYAADEKLFKNLYEKLYAWAIPRGLIDMGNLEKTKDIVIYHDDPGITEPEKLRISVGTVVPPETEVSGEIGKLTIPEGKYALGRFILSGQEYGEAWQYVCGVWMPGSGYQPDEGYCFEMYNYNPEAMKEGKFDTTICVPVKPM